MLFKRELVQNRVLLYWPMTVLAIAITVVQDGSLQVKIIYLENLILKPMNCAMKMVA